MFVEEDSFFSLEQARATPRGVCLTSNYVAALFFKKDRTSAVYAYELLLPDKTISTAPIKITGDECVRARHKAGSALITAICSANGAVLKNHIYIAVDLTESRTRIVCRYDLVSKHLTVLNTPRIQGTVYRMVSTASKLVLQHSNKIEIYDLTTAHIGPGVDVPFPADLVPQTVRQYKNMLLATLHSERSGYTMSVDLSTNTVVEPPRRCPAYLDFCIDSGSGDIYYVYQHAVKLWHAASGKRALFLEFDDEEGLETTDCAVNKYAFALIMGRKVEGYWKPTDSDAAAVFKASSASSSKSSIENWLPAFIKAAVLRRSLQRHNAWVNEEIQLTKSVPPRVLPIYTLEGHGQEFVNTGFAYKLPPHTLLVTFAQCGESTYQHNICRFMELFQNADMHHVLANPDRYMQKLSRTLRIPPVNINVYTPGMHMPILKYSPLSYLSEDDDKDDTPWETLPSGVKRFPFVSPYARPPVPLDECAHFTFPIFHTDKVSLESVSKVFDQSFYPTPEMVMDYVECSAPEEITFKKVGDHFSVDVPSLIHQLGPGIYYYSSCRDVSLPKEATHRDVRSINRSISTIKDAEKKQKKVCTYP
jgi:hypothetical protein